MINPQTSLDTLTTNLLAGPVNMIYRTRLSKNTSLTTTQNKAVNVYFGIKGLITQLFERFLEWKRWDITEEELTGTYQTDVFTPWNELTRRPFVFQGQKLTEKKVLYFQRQKTAPYYSREGADSA